MPESAKALWRMVSLTAAKTSRMFEVSVACVRLWGEKLSAQVLLIVLDLDPFERSETVRNKIHTSACTPSASARFAV